MISIIFYKIRDYHYLFSSSIHTPTGEAFWYAYKDLAINYFRPERIKDLREELLNHSPCCSAVGYDMLIGVRV